MKRSATNKLFKGVLSRCAIVVVWLGMAITSADAHGIVGDRFFPATIATDDPFAVDELALPTVSYFKSPAVERNPAMATTDVGFEFDKEIFPKFALGISGDWLHLKPDGEPASQGFDNFTLSAKYQLWQSEKHEAIFSVGGKWEIGGTGSGSVGADAASTFSPEIFFGKGFGDLPGQLKYARPLAITGVLAQNVPDSAAPDSLEWGFSVEYSLPYLESEVKDIGLPRPIRQMIPLVEFSFETPENRSGGPITGTINPGVLYESRYFQIGAEAIIPANRDSGYEVGAVIQFSIFIDGLFSKQFGHPLFGNRTTP